MGGAQNSPEYAPGRRTRANNYLRQCHSLAEIGGRGHDRTFISDFLSRPVISVEVRIFRPMVRGLLLLPTRGAYNKILMTDVLENLPLEVSGATSPRFIQIRLIRSILL